MSEANASWSDLDGIAVTIGPGLVGLLPIGVNLTKAIALARGLLTGINHGEVHIYAHWLMSHTIDFPVVCLIISGDTGVWCS